MKFKKEKMIIMRKCLKNYVKFEVGQMKIKKYFSFVVFKY